MDSVLPLNSALVAGDSVHFVVETLVMLDVLVSQADAVVKPVLCFPASLVLLRFHGIDRHHLL